MIGRYLSSRRGAAAAEFGLWLAVLTPLVLNGVDLGFYVFQAIEVRHAAQTAAQAALALCGGPASTAPVSVNCSNFNTRLSAAVQTTSLGSKVSWATSSEGWYCVSNTTISASGSTETIVPGGTTSGSMSSTAPTCSNGNAAGDYLFINVTYTYHPLFSNVTAASLLGSTITATVPVRVS